MHDIFYLIFYEMAYFRSYWSHLRKGASFADITQKALFLLALASGKRRGELHALTREGLSLNHDKTVVYCGFDPTFLSKTQPKTGIVMAPLVIRALSYFIGPADPEFMSS